MWNAEHHLLLKLILPTFHMAYWLFLNLGHLYLTKQSVPKWQIKGLGCIWKKPNKPTKLNKSTWQQVLKVFPVQEKTQTSVKTSAVLDFKN